MMILVRDYCYLIINILIIIIVVVNVFGYCHVCKYILNTLML